MWVNCGPPATSPTAKARRLVVRNRASTVMPLVVVANRFIGEKGDRLEPGNRGKRWPGARRYHKAAWPDLDIAGADRAGIGEPRLSAQDADAQPLKAFHRIVRRDSGNHLLDAVPDGSKIDLRRR